MSASPTPGVSPSPGPSSGPANRHAPTAVEKQRMQVEKLLKDPAKPAYIPPAPKEASIRPAREMMKNVQGSSAGAGSGEFHVYKASRRREYERLKLMDEKSKKEAAEREFEEKRRQLEEEANAKTAKNRAKRQKKKERSKVKGTAADGEHKHASDDASGAKATSNLPLKKRRLVNGAELIFKVPGEDGEDSEDGIDNDDGDPAVHGIEGREGPLGEEESKVVAAETAKIIIHDD